LSSHAVSKVDNSPDGVGFTGLGFFWNAHQLAARAGQELDDDLGPAMVDGREFDQLSSGGTRKAFRVRLIVASRRGGLPGTDPKTPQGAGVG